MKKQQLALIGSLIMFVACGGGTGEVGGDDDTGGPDAAVVDPGTPLDLSGAWASRVTNSQIFDGILGPDTVVLTNLSLIQLEQTGTAVTTMTTVCAVGLTPYVGNQTTYPPAAVAAIEDRMASATLSVAESGATYTNAPTARLIGWHADSDPAGEELPDQAGDSRIDDPDDDGHPGVTLRVEGSVVAGDIYIVNRTTVSLDGIVLSEERIEGRSRTEQAQNIIAATDPLLTLSSITATPDPEQANSSFVMVRVANDDSCASILAAGDALFE